MWCSEYDTDSEPNPSLPLTSQGSLGKVLKLLDPNFCILCKTEMARIPQWAFTRSKHKDAVGVQLSACLAKAQAPLAVLGEPLSGREHGACSAPFTKMFLYQGEANSCFSLPWVLIPGC